MESRPEQNFLILVAYWGGIVHQPHLLVAIANIELDYQQGR